MKYTVSSMAEGFKTLKDALYFGHIHAAKSQKTVDIMRHGVIIGRIVVLDMGFTQYVPTEA